VHEPLGKIDTSSVHRLIRWVRGRSPVFWICTALAAIAFIAIMTDQKTYRDYTLAARIGNAIGAALFFGLFPALIAWLFKRARSSFRKPAFGNSPQRIVSHAKEEANYTHIQYQANGTTSFPLGPENLHHWIRDGVLPRWEHGLYSDAIAEAARALTAATQEKLRRWDITDLKLMQQAFSLEPPKPGAPRLRFMGDRTTQTWTSRMNGASGLAQGCYSGIRNIVAHERAVSWESQTAVEYIFAFNILARWADECEVHRID
jgi:uncharacterized protein Ymh